MNNQDIFINANKSLAEGKFDEFLTYCSEEIQWNIIGEKSYFGKDELLKYISSAYDGVMFTTQNYIKENEFVVEFGQITFKVNEIHKTSSYCDI